MRIGKGLCGPDAPSDRAARKDGACLLGAATAPSSASMRSLVPYVFNQGASEACTAHAGAMAIHLALLGAGKTSPIMPSPRVGYALDRLVEAPGQPLTDIGSTLAAYCRACAEWGCVPLAAPTPDGTDIDPSNVNVQPSLALLVEASHCLEIGTHALDVTSPSLVATACGLIAQGIPLYVGGFVDSAYESYTAGQAPLGPPNEADTNGGGHAQVVLGFSTQPDGSRVFQVLSSWGSGWGDAGCAWVTESWLRALWDVVPMTVTEIDS